MKNGSSLWPEGSGFSSKTGETVLFVLAVFVLPAFLFLSCSREDSAEPAGMERHSDQMKQTGFAQSDLPAEEKAAAAASVEPSASAVSETGPGPESGLSASTKEEKLGDRSPAPDQRYFGMEYVYYDGSPSPDSVTLLHVPDPDIVHYTVPDGVTSISSAAFLGCNRLESVIFPNSVTSIRDRAFEGKKKLKKVVLPAHVSIGSHAFCECTELESVTIGKDAGVASSVPDNAAIGELAFGWCRKLTHFEFPAGIREIRKNAFEECKLLESVVIPKGVTSIGAGAFLECEALKSVAIPDGVKEIGENAFCGCNALEEIEIPDSVCIIRKGAFHFLSNLKSVKIPAHVSIGADAFSHCPALESVRVGMRGTLAKADSDLEEKVFAGCANLRYFEFPERIREIPNHMFENCRLLESVSIPDGVKTIGESAFFECYALKEVGIPDSVEAIGKGAFSQCDALREVRLSATHPVFIGEYAFSGCISLRRFAFPPGTTRIERGALFTCQGLESVELPNGVREIGKEAFFGCKSLKETRLPDSLETIGYSAFCGCENLKIDALPANLKYIGDKAFWACGELKTTVLPDGIESFADAFDLSVTRPLFSPGNARYRFTDEGVLIDGTTETLVLAPQSLQGHYTIPDGIRAIGPRAFRLCRISGVTIPASVTGIGAGAFTKSGLEEIVIPATVTDFGEEGSVSGVFIPDLHAYDNVDFSPLHDVERGVFGSCLQLKRVNLPDNMKRIPPGMFNSCISLSEIALPAGLESIGKNAFYSCRNLKRIALPGKVEAIEENAFDGAGCEQYVREHYRNLMK